VPATVLESRSVFDQSGSHHIVFFGNSSRLMYTTNALHVVEPRAGNWWPANSVQTVRWEGPGPVEVALSTDGGFSFVTLGAQIHGNKLQITVPDVETDQAVVSVSRASPNASAQSRSFQIWKGAAQQLTRAVVASTSVVGMYPSLALDDHGRPAMTYMDSTSFDLRYAYRSGGTWLSEIVQSAGLVGQYSSLRFDDQARAHVAYQDQNNFTLRYATRTGPHAWSVEAVVDSGAGVGAHASLVLGRSGAPGIAYVDNASGGKIKYAYRPAATWIKESLPDVGVGHAVSLALDESDRPFVAYYDLVNADLRLAEREPTGWTSELVDSAGSVGQFVSLAIDRDRQPHVAYYDQTRKSLRYAHRGAAGWFTEVADTASGVGRDVSLRLTAAGVPVIAYYDSSAQALKLCRKFDDEWAIEVLDRSGSVGSFASLALDAEGRARIAYYDMLNGDLRYSSEAVEISSPGPGADWPVGSRREIHWDGAGLVDVSLSSDGGATYSLLGSGISGQSFRLTVPNVASGTCKVKVERRLTPSVAVSDSFFAITGGVSLLALEIRPLESGTGARLTWRSDPGPEDLAGYRLERRDPAGGWRVLASGLRTGSYEDASAGMGSAYRLTAVNGLGEEFLLGETVLVPAVALSAWPSPYRSGPMNLSFFTDGGTTPVEVGLYDIGGRKVADLARGQYPAGGHHVLWDGRDRAGTPVRAGMYFVRSRNTGHDHTLKLVVLH
jgi:hypothetical protein